MRNYGLDLEREKAEHAAEDWVFGATQSPVCIARIPIKDRDAYLPKGEVQDKQELVNEQFLAFKEHFPDIIREVFAEELKKFFKITGINAKTVLVTTATIIGALVVIGGGAKAMLGWLGFTLMK